MQIGSVLIPDLVKSVQGKIGMHSSRWRAAPGCTEDGIKYLCAPTWGLELGAYIRNGAGGQSPAKLKKRTQGTDVQSRLLWKLFWLWIGTVVLEGSPT